MASGLDLFLLPSGNAHKLLTWYLACSIPLMCISYLSLRFCFYRRCFYQPIYAPVADTPGARHPTPTISLDLPL